uniref:Trigger factor ribosome-binding bacterial domain-containing protein n=1 Tax=Oryza sativa subsp. japonica TaxID=39947 RepID=Q69IM1_ORYSJ|nr:unknown protein [Oryza sativa Japonica Group]BAD34433.1 unknown protein [Oryza sativa Japonica Group]
MAMAMGLLAKNPKMINHRYASDMQLQHRLSPACSVMFNKQCSYRITRKACSVLGAVSPIQCTETSTESLVSFKDFLVSVQTEEDGLIKLRVTVADTMTESIFEKVFSKNVAAAQPLPGFRRMKGDTKRDCSALNWAIKGEERNHQEYHQPHNCRICPKGGPRCIKKSEGSTDL